MQSFRLHKVSFSCQNMIYFHSILRSERKTLATKVVYPMRVASKAWAKKINVWHTISIHRTHFQSSISIGKFPVTLFLFIYILAIFVKWICRWKPNAKKLIPKMLWFAHKSFRLYFLRWGKSKSPLNTRNRARFDAQMWQKSPEA